MAKLSLNTAPATQSITVSELNAHARIDVTDENTLATNLIVAAEAAAEEFCLSKFVTQTWDQYFDGFAEPLVLSLPPVGTVSYVHYIDADGVEQTLSTDVWEQAELLGVGIVRRKYDQSWPDVRTHPDSVIVQFSCGYGAAASVPQPIRQAIAVHAAHFFQFREGEQPVPESFARLLCPHSYRTP